MKCSILFGAALAALAFGTVSANAGLLYSFEPTDAGGPTDGFGPNGLIPIPSAVGATQGVGSLELLQPAPGGGYAGAYTTTDLPADLANPALSAITLDLTIPATPVFAGGYSNIFFGLYVSNPGLGLYGDQYVPPNTDWPNADLPPGTTTLGVTIPVEGNDPVTGLPISFAGLLGEGWYVSGFQLLLDGNAGETIFVDNVQGVVPEPASLGLLAACGGLALTRRRKAK
jgi:hypothetical protein